MSTKAVCCTAVMLTTGSHHLNPFKPSGIKWLHFGVFRAVLVYPTLFNFLDIWALLLLRTECQSAHMSKNYNGGLDQYSAECFGRLLLATIGKSVGLKALTLHRQW